MEPWKCISLLSPPVQTTEIREGVDIKGLKHTCENIIRVLSKQSPLHREGALLSRFVYKYDKKFRNDIGYRNIRKTNSTMHKYLKVNLLKDLENFTAVLPNEGDDFIPTRQMLEYLLSRIITFAKLMLRIIVCSKQAAVFYMDRVKRGESHWMSLMPYALLSRIWSMSSVLLQHSTSWYTCLHPFLTLLQPKGLKFLPEGNQLPNDLHEWLDLRNLDTFGKLQWSQRKSIAGLDLLEDEDDVFGNILEYVNDINDVKPNEYENYSNSEVLKVDYVSRDQEYQASHGMKMDIGQSISRDSFISAKLLQNIEDGDCAPVLNATVLVQERTKIISDKSLKMLTNFQKKINRENHGTHYFGKVTNVESLKAFLDLEETFRNDGNDQSLTKHLSFMQWHSLKISLLKICKSILNNKKIERKLSKVWKEKCLEYM